VLERLSGALVLRTDEHGAVRLETDGRRLWASASRWSLVAGRWSLVAGRWSLVAGRWSLVSVSIQHP